MLKCKIYSKYYPITNRQTQFTEKEKQKLCRWADNFKWYLKQKEVYLIENFHTNYYTYDLNEYNTYIMKEMIEDNCISDDYYLEMLNIIIYSHEYNAFLSFLFPKYHCPRLSREQLKYVKPIKISEKYYHKLLEYDMYKMMC